MVSIRVFTNHSRTCPFKGDRYHRTCDCWKWFQWQQDKKQYRVSAKTRGWREAQAEAQRSELATLLGASAFTLLSAIPAPTGAVCTASRKKRLDASR